MESSHSPTKLPTETIDYIFSHTDASGAKILINVSKEYSASKELWLKILPKGFSIPKEVDLRAHILSHIIKENEAGILPKIRDFFLNLKMNENSKLQFAFIKPNASFATPSVELGITFKNPTKKNKVEQYLFAKEFVPSCMIDSPSSAELENLTVNYSYFPETGLPSFIMEMKERAHEHMIEYVKDNTEIDITSAKTNPAGFLKAVLKAGIATKVSEYIKMKMPNAPLVHDKDSKLTSEEYELLTKLVTAEVMKLDREMSLANIFNR